MSVPPEKTRMRRITVALRGHAAEARLLRSAARLARDTAAELTGVFLEDIDLLRLAELPLALGRQAARFRMLIHPETAQLLDAVREQRPSMLVVPAVETSLLTDTVHALQGRLDCPALLVR